MDYFKVKKEVPVYKRNDRKHALVCVRTLIENELYTKKELEKLFSGAEFANVAENEISFR